MTIETYVWIFLLSVITLAIWSSVDWYVRNRAQKLTQKDPVIGVDQFTEQRRAALPFQKVATKGFDARRPFLDRGIDRDGQRRRELGAAIDLSADKKVVH